MQYFKSSPLWASTRFGHVSLKLRSLCYEGLKPIHNLLQDIPAFEAFATGGHHHLQLSPTKMKLPSLSIVEILSPISSPRTPASGGLGGGGGGARRPRRRGSSTSAPESPSTPPPLDLTAVSRPVLARQLRRCACPDVLACCLCSELTRTRDGVCDMCLYGIHVEERGERESCP